MGEQHDHDRFVHRWLERAVPTDDSAVLRATVERACARVLQRAACALGEPATAAVAAAVLVHAAERFPALTETDLDGEALSVPALGPAPRDAARFLLAELLAGFSRASAQVLAQPLHAALADPAGAPCDRLADGAPTDAAARLAYLRDATLLVARGGPLDALLPALAARATSALPLRTAVLVDGRGDAPRAFAWHADDATPLEHAELRALSWHAYLAAHDGPAPDEVRGTGAAPAGGRPASAFVTLPLAAERPRAFGVLQFELDGPCEESALELVAAVAAALSGALQPAEPGARATTDGAAPQGDVAQRELLSVVSHDLRNPLSAILMSVALLLRRQTGVDPRDAGLRQLEVIKRSGERMNHLIQNLLDAGALEAGPLAIEPQPHALAPIVADALRLLQPTAQGKSVRLELAPRGAQGCVLVDRDRVLQALSNLLNAAVRFVAKGGAITVYTEPSEREVRLVVQSSGPALGAEETEHLFDRQWWAQRTSGLGTGLALSVTKGIAEAHGGQVSVAPAPAGGNTFALTLPAAPAEETGARSESSGVDRA